MNSVWFTCEDCQYTVQILGCEAEEHSKTCPLCEGNMLPQSEQDT